MGREIKRVTAKFDWPMKEIWKGYVFPYRPKQCYACKENSGSYGYTKEARKLSNEWYGFHKTDWVYPNGESGRRYNNAATQYHLTQDEVDLLARKGRLMDFTHTWTQKSGWREKKPAYHPTAEEVNEWAKVGVGHDSLNQGYVVEFRCKKLGLPYTCSVCKGSGELWQSPEIEKAAEEWERIDPPSGTWWQLWENVSEGSPITPAFPTSKKLVDYLVRFGDAWEHKWTREQAEGMIDKGSVLSGMAQGGKFYNAEESAAL